MLRAASSPPELAIPIHRKILSLLPEFTPAQLALADILVNTQDSLAQAETLARQARQRHPDNPQACSILAMASFKRGNLPEAKRLLTELATIRPLLPAELAALNTARGSN